MYKDVDRQREANRVSQAKHRQGMTSVDSVIPEQTKSVIPGITPCKASASTKRGDDIKCFEDLPSDVQADIRRLARDYTALDGKPVSKEQDFTDRTARAINYQHLFPDGFYSGGRETLCFSKMG